MPHQSDTTDGEAPRENTEEKKPAAAVTKQLRSIQLETLLETVHALRTTDHR
jgi:hypothetical protein